MMTDGLGLMRIGEFDVVLLSSRDVGSQVDVAEAFDRCKGASEEGYGDWKL